MKASADSARLVGVAPPQAAASPAHPLLVAQRLMGNRAVARLVAQRSVVDEPKAPPGGMQAIVDREPKSTSALSPGARTITEATPPGFVISNRGANGFAFVHTTKASVTSTCLWPTKGDHAMAAPKPGSSVPRIIRVGSGALVDKLRDGEHEHGADAEVVFAATLGCASNAMARLDGTTAATAEGLRTKLAAAVPTRWAKVGEEPWIADYSTLSGKARGHRDPFPHLAGMSGSETTVGGKKVWLDELQQGQAFNQIKSPADTSKVTADAAALGVCGTAAKAPTKNPAQVPGPAPKAADVSDVPGVEPREVGGGEEMATASHDRIVDDACRAGQV